MSILSPVMLEDVQHINKAEYIPWEQLRDSRVLVTGASGLIGKNLIAALLYANRARQLNLQVTALVHRRESAVMLQELADDALQVVVGDIATLQQVDGPVDYIIHSASVTDSRSFVQRPVEVMQTAANGTMNLLQLAVQKQVKGFLYLSSMEVYGHPERGHAVCESESAGFDPENARNSYPISKQFCEMLGNAYAREYGVPFKTIRLTQTFGPGVMYDDKRVFAEFMRCALEKRNIVLKTLGLTERCYLYTADAITAMLAVLLKGKNGACYTAANPDTYCSIAEMARMVAEKTAGNAISVEFQLDDANQSGFADTLYMQLDVTRIRSLGWTPERPLMDMYVRMIAWVQEQANSKS